MAKKKMFDCEYLYNGKKCPQKNGVCAAYADGKVDELCRVRVPSKNERVVKRRGWIMDIGVCKVATTDRFYMECHWDTDAKIIPCTISYKLPKGAK